MSLLPPNNCRHNLPTNTRAHLRAASVLLLLFSGCVAQSVAQPTQSALTTRQLYVGMHRVTAEVAVTPQERAIGLMGRRSLPEHSGMLFVFEHAQTQCFWMAQTFVPLSIAFLKDDGTITNIEHMQPLSRQSHCSSEPVRFVLEVNQGWFEQRHITPGTRVMGLPDSK